MQRIKAVAVVNCFFSNGERYVFSFFFFVLTGMNRCVTIFQEDQLMKKTFFIKNWVFQLLLVLCWLVSYQQYLLLTVISSTGEKYDGK